MSHDHQPFRKWVEQEADLIEADGCSFVTNSRKICCLIHDLEYYYGKDASNAYVHYLSGEEDYWFLASITERKIADGNFINCMRREAWLGFFSPLAFIRQLIKPLGGKAWDKHRKREQDAKEKEKANQV